MKYIILLLAILGNEAYSADWGRHQFTPPPSIPASMIVQRPAMPLVAAPAPFVCGAQCEVMKPNAPRKPGESIIWEMPPSVGVQPPKRR